MNKKEIEDLKRFVKDFVCEKNKLPTSYDFIKKNGSPCSINAIIKEFGNIRTFYSSIGYDTSRIRCKKCVVDDDVMREYIETYIEKNGISPGINDFKRRLGCPYNKTSILNKYTSVKKMYDFFDLKSKPIGGVNNHDLISDETILENLKNAIYSSRSTDREYVRKNNMLVYDRSVYERRFGTWSNAVLLSGITEHKKILMYLFPDYMGENEVEFIVKKIGKDGRLNEKQLRLLSENPSYGTIRNNFKSMYLYKILKGDSVKYRAKCVPKRRANDGHICDSYAESVVDDMLYSNDILHEIHGRYPNSKKIYDFKVNDVYIEYAGLYYYDEEYRKRIEFKKKMCSDNNFKLYILYDYTIGSLNDMIKFLKENRCGSTQQCVDEEDA